MTLTFTILGCGSSAGVPRLGAGWGACNPANPKNRRRRCSLLVERHDAEGVTRVLVDTSPDLREQLLDAGVHHLDAVLITHEHADHTHGIDDLRSLALHQRRRIPVYLDQPTSDILRVRFRYCFETPSGSSYPPILDEHRIEPARLLTIEGAGGPLSVLPFLQDHGDIAALGFRFGALAYSCDLKAMPLESERVLAGLEVWVVDALRYMPHPSHFSVDDALAWIARVRPCRAILTNMHADLDYDALQSRLPAHVEPAYDGMRFSLTDSHVLASHMQTVS
jgi:phosphoribosyl 1,2-cyclic phosphate phosphodiesterase